MLVQGFVLPVGEYTQCFSNCFSYFHTCGLQRGRSVHVPSNVVSNIACLHIPPYLHSVRTTQSVYIPYASRYLYDLSCNVLCCLFAHMHFM